MFGFGRKKFSYTCACCGQAYEGSPSMAYNRPSYYFDVPEAERDQRVKIDDDLCHIRARAGEDSDDDIFAIRATLDVPIHKVAQPFCWGLWVTQSRANFFRYIETFSGDQSAITTFGWLSVTIPHYDRKGPGEHFESLGCDVKWDVKGQRPKIVLHESDHPLFQDQRHGISWDQAVTIAQSHMRIVHGKS